MTSLYSRKTLNRKRTRRSYSSKTLLNTGRLTYQVSNLNVNSELQNGGQGFIFTGNKTPLSFNLSQANNVNQNFETRSLSNLSNANVHQNSLSFQQYTTTNSVNPVLSSIKNGITSANQPNLVNSVEIIKGSQPTSTSTYSFYTRTPFQLAKNNQQRCPVIQSAQYNASQSLPDISQCSLHEASNQQDISPYYFLSPNGDFNSVPLSYLKQSYYSPIVNSADHSLSYTVNSSNLQSNSKSSRKVLKHTRTGKRSTVSTTTSSECLLRKQNNMVVKLPKESNQNCVNGDAVSPNCYPLSIRTEACTNDCQPGDAILAKPDSSASHSSNSTSTHHRSKCKRGRLTDSQSSPSQGATSTSLPLNYLTQPFTNPFTNPNCTTQSRLLGFDLQFKSSTTSSGQNATIQDVCKCFNCIEARKIRDCELQRKAMKNDCPAPKNIELLRRGMRTIIENKDEVSEHELKKCISELVKQDAHSLIASLEPLCQVRVRLANTRIQAQLQEGIDSPELARRFVDVLLDEYQRLKEDAEQQTKILEDLESNYLAKQGLSWKLICQYRFYKEVFQVGNLQKLLEGNFLDQLKPDHDSTSEDCNSYLKQYLDIDTELEQVNRVWKDLQVESEEWKLSECDTSFDILGGEALNYEDTSCDSLLQNYLNSVLNSSFQSSNSGPSVYENASNSLFGTSLSEGSASTNNDICTICDNPAGLHYHARSAHLQPPSLSPSGDSSDSSGEASSTSSSYSSDDAGYDAEEETEILKSQVSQSCFVPPANQPMSLPFGAPTSNLVCCNTNPYSQPPNANSYSLLYGTHPSVWMPQPLMPNNANWPTTARLPDSNGPIFSSSTSIFQQNCSAPGTTNRSNMFTPESMSKYRTVVGNGTSQIPSECNYNLSNSSSIAVQASGENTQIRAGLNTANSGGGQFVHKNVEQPINDATETCSGSATDKEVTGNVTNNNNKLCDCCQCEMFGHNPSVLAPNVKRSYEERRQQLLDKLAKRKEKKQSMNPNSKSRSDCIDKSEGPSPLADVDELLNFINGDDSGQSTIKQLKEPSNKKNPKKEKKKSKQQQLQQKKLQQKEKDPKFEDNEKEEQDHLLKADPVLGEFTNETKTTPAVIVDKEVESFKKRPELDVVHNFKASDTCEEPSARTNQEEGLLDEDNTKQTKVKSSQQSRKTTPEKPSKPSSAVSNENCNTKEIVSVTIQPSRNINGTPVKSYSRSTKTFTNRNPQNYARHQTGAMNSGSFTHKNKTTRTNYSAGPANFSVSGHVVSSSYHHKSNQPSVVGPLASTNGRIVFNSAVSGSLDNRPHRSKFSRNSYRGNGMNDGNGNSYSTTNHNIKPLIPQSFILLPKKSEVPYNGDNVNKTDNQSINNHRPVIQTGSLNSTKPVPSCLASGVMTTKVDSVPNENLKTKKSAHSCGENDLVDIFAPQSPESTKSMENDYDPIVEEFKRMLINTGVPADRIKLDEGIINMDQFVKHSKKK